MYLDRVSRPDHRAGRGHKTHIAQNLGHFFRRLFGITEHHGLNTKMAQYPRQCLFFFIAPADDQVLLNAAALMHGFT